nr:TRAV25.2 [Sphenodon punctatus]
MESEQMNEKRQTGVLQCKAEIVQDSLAEASDGKETNLSCNHTSAFTSDSILWYRQFPNQGPRFLISTYKGKVNMEDPKGALIVAEDRKSSILSISRVTLEDSAVYFCALSPQCNDHGKFGVWKSGHKADESLPDLQKSEPSVYELESTNKSHPLSACLFTDYFPGNINVSATGSDLVGIESSVVVVEDQASYGAVLWQNANENLQCIANYDGEDIQAKKDIADSCSGTQMSFQTDERLNLLSLTVLGLRVIFFKSVAVNLLLTFRLWSR